MHEISEQGQKYAFIYTKTLKWSRKFWRGRVNLI